jgi:hypothetical protein
MSKPKQPTNITAAEIAKRDYKPNVGWQRTPWRSECGKHTAQALRNRHEWLKATKKVR